MPFAPEEQGTGTAVGMEERTVRQQRKASSCHPTLVRFGFQVRLVFGIGFYQESMGKPGLWLLWSVGIV